MAWYRCTGGGSNTPLNPILTSTTICSNPSHTMGTVTFTDDYHNYDFLMFNIYNHGSNPVISLLATPDEIDDMRSISGNKINFNHSGTNLYICYSVSSDHLTWSVYGYRDDCIDSVVGINCTNKTVVATRLYKATSVTATTVVVTSQTAMSSYDFILFAANSPNNSADEVQVAETYRMDSTDYVPALLSNALSSGTFVE